MNVLLDTVKTDEFVMDYCRFGCGKGNIVIIPGLSVQSVMPSAQAIAQGHKGSIHAAYEGDAIVFTLKLPLD